MFTGESSEILPVASFFGQFDLRILPQLLRGIMEVGIFRPENLKDSFLDWVKIA
jgi:hypothetical protein